MNGNNVLFDSNVIIYASKGLINIWIQDRE